MCIHRASSVPTGLIVADFFVHASVPFAQHCYTTLLRTQRGKRKNALELGKESDVPQKLGRVAMYSLPAGGSPTLRSGGKNQKWPTTRLRGYITPTLWGVPSASGWGKEAEVAHTWAGQLHNRYHLEGPQRFKVRLQSGERSPKWPTSDGPGGYITRAAFGVPNASQWGQKSGHKLGCAKRAK